jgi:hypothetical protein
MYMRMASTHDGRLTIFSMQWSPSFLKLVWLSELIPKEPQLQRERHERFGEIPRRVVDQIFLN